MRLAARWVPALLILLAARRMRLGRRAAARPNIVWIIVDDMVSHVLFVGVGR